MQNINTAIQTVTIPELFGGMEITFAPDIKKDFIDEFLIEITTGETRKRLDVLYGKVLAKMEVTHASR